MDALSISIVTPSYNQGQFIEQTILSIISQDYPRVQYIIVDGGSNDNTMNIINRYSDQIDYWISEADSGQSDAIAKGFDLATGDILGWTNSDDVLLPGALSRVAEYFEKHGEAEVLSGGCYSIDAYGNPLTAEYPWSVYALGAKATYRQFQFYGMGLVRQPATFWRRSTYISVGGIDKTLQFIMDRDLFIRMAQRRRFHVLRSLLAGFRHHDDSKSVTILDVRAEEDRLFAERYGRMNYSTIFQLLMYWRYRLPILFAKTFLFFLRKVGMVKLRPIRFGLGKK